ncbi:hypothetical protein B0H15DRAFT_947410 [Mycena belliarum]|uniref:Uncharacterized protein n=1 Tax=Mycena belliarum TaxID=1033014 RepID=A0AAD6XPB8_9AGAR|nr:hypothetical protein B0H15DRAFT_947410 [Mycena belliae]
MTDPSLSPAGGQPRAPVPHLDAPTAPPGPLGPVLRLLKGADARIRTISEHFGLQTHVKILYDSGENYATHETEVVGHAVLADDVLNTERVNEESGVELYAVLEARAPTVPLHWVTKITEKNRVGSSCIAYGNEASLAHVYGNAALFVKVPPYGEGIRAAQ